MYNSNHIRYSKQSDFGIGQWLLNAGISENPSEVIEDFKQLGSLKKMVSKPLVNPNLSQRFNALTDDAGAAVGVLGTTVGTGIKKYGGKLLSETGDNIRRWGIDNVVDDNKRQRLGKNVMAGAGLAGGSLLAAGGIVGAAKLSDKLSGIPDPEEYDDYPMYTSYRKATWKTVDFYH